MQGNLRHAAALALVGWCLGVILGKIVPKGCLNCGFPQNIEAESCVAEFKTETECRFGGYKYIQDFYVTTDKRGDLVVVPPEPECHENAPDDPRLKEK